MIKFFRKIRENLLLEGKITKYFKYAIGEIVLGIKGLLDPINFKTKNPPLAPPGRGSIGGYYD